MSYDQEETRDYFDELRIIFTEMDDLKYDLDVLINQVMLSYPAAMMTYTHFSSLYYDCTLQKFKYQETIAQTHQHIQEVEEIVLKIIVVENESIILEECRKLLSLCNTRRVEIENVAVLLEEYEKFLSINVCRQNSAAPSA